MLSVMPVTAAVFCYRQIFIKCWTKRKQKEWITYLKDVTSNQGEWSDLLVECYRKCGGSSLLCAWKQQCCHHTVVIFRNFSFLSVSYLKFTYWNVHIFNFVCLQLGCKTCSAIQKLHGNLFLVNIFMNPLNHCGFVCTSTSSNKNCTHSVYMCVLFSQSKRCHQYFYSL
jgi:hypothetical protein